MQASSRAVANNTELAAIEEKAAGAQRRLLRFLFGALILACLLRFAAPGLEAGFNADDPMNIHYYWSRGAGRLLLNLPSFFTTYQRPLGGVYFSVLYQFFGLDPLPYHAVLLALLVVNTFLAYRFGLLLSGSELTGGLTALGVAYHARMAHLVYLPAFVFDVLCFTFYFLALTYYISRRRGGARLTRKQTAVFLLLYVCALDSKEMAITMPAIVLAYEAIRHPPDRLSFAAASRWLRGEALPAGIAGAMTLAYIFGKTFGRESLVGMPAYHPVFTWSRYLESTTRFVNTILYAQWWTPAAVAALAAILLGAALLSGRKHLLLMWVFIWVAPLPITFVPGRGEACLYIPLAGWALTAATFFVSLCRALAGSRTWMAALVTLGIWLWYEGTALADRHVPPGIRKPGQLTWSVIQQVRALQPSVKPGSRIYVVRGPFPDWDMKFIMELVYGDRTVNVWLGEKVPLPPEEIRKMDYVFTFENGTLIRLQGR
jgi:hypothetical protein